MNLFLPAFVALNRRIILSLSSCICCDTLTDVILAAHVPSGALFGPLITAPAPDVGLPITWGATRVARCAGESDERGSPSTSFRVVAR